MRRPQIFFLAACLVLPVSAETGMAKGNPVKQAAARMTVPPGFAVDLIAGEPDVVQPIAMCFDSRGRIWVAEGLTYPNRAKDGEGKDRILIFEDSDGNGTFESRKVFADGLNLVSGLETGFGGVFVGAAPNLMFLADADGDDRADGEPEILLDGWGYEDTHETLNSFIWGPDGWLYGCHGIFSHSKVGKPDTPDDERVPLNAGIWRYHPVSRKFEVFAHGTSNPWGLDFNDWGDAFIEACVIPHLWHIIPGGYYQRQAGSHFNKHIYDPIETIADHRHWVGDIKDHAHWGKEESVSKEVADAGGGHAHSGFAICLSDAFPAEMRGSALFFNIHGHRLNRDILERNGSGWTGKHAPDVMISNDEWFLGVAIESGPDGALYFTDWHDETSCHRTDPLRWNRGNGRVYRLRHGDVKPWQGDITKLSDLELAKAQAGRDEWQLRTARRVLQERLAEGAKIDPAAKEFLLQTMRSHPDETRRLRALWCLAACDLLDKASLPLNDGHESVRAWAVRLAAQGGFAIERSHWLRLASKETSPVVLLSLCSALPKLPREISSDIARWIAPKMTEDDPNLTRMFWFGFESQVPRDEARAMSIAMSCPDDRLAKWTARRLESPDALVSALGSAGERAGLLLDALKERLDEKPDEKLSAPQLEIISGLAMKSEQAKAAAIVERSGGQQAIARLWSRVEDRAAPAPDRLEAFRLLVTFLEDKDIERLSGLLDDPALRLPAITAKPALLDHDATNDRIAGFSVEEKGSVARLAATEGKAARLLEWVAAMKLKTRDVPADAVVRLREVRDPSLQEEIERLWGRPAADADARRAAIVEWQGKLSPDVLTSADKVRGRAIFDRTCAACHKLFGEGGLIGPELTGGERGSVHHWLDNILDPNALIGQGYELHRIDKNDGTTFTGMLAGENDTELIFRMVGVETRVPKSEVKANTALGTSMMPEGLLTGLSDDEVRDLIGYLMSPGQVEKP
ncbi:c-type cytochrome [Luteolibacter flavescens]|uniref:C-type cytochrome n=1 Tax=Luteolibacter flavescens TaxID=1859460 RepID=A0ABT3FNA6_9BACT|nr:PVC-type heme-binding CxxCH protein [Luteolibacter flavescens]MCW1885060.1 c-type cytochrome [Luteolibacter flavescens]